MANSSSSTNPWEGVAGPITSATVNQTASPWDGIAAPVEQPPLEVQPQGMALDQPIPADPAQRSFLDKLNRQIQLAGRYGVEGLTGAAQFPATAAIAIANGTRSLADSAMGIPQTGPSIEYPATYTSKALDAIGMPTPESEPERIEGDVLRSITGANVLPGANAARTTGAATGGLFAGEARERGYGPVGQTVAALAGGSIGSGLLYPGAKLVGGALQPLLPGGQQQIAANLLARYADNPQVAAAALQNAQEYVPGSTPIAGGASKDLGLLGLEKTLLQDPRNYFGQRLSDQNSARWNMLTQAAGTPEDIAQAELDRQAATAPLYEQAKGQYLNPTPIKPIVAAIDKELQFRDPVTTGSNLNRIKQNIERNLPAETGDSSALIPQQRLIDAYRVERDRLNAAAGQGGYDSATIGNVARPFNQSLGTALESQSPQFAQAQGVYRDMSVPIDQMTAAQLINQNLSGGATRDIAGNPIIPAGKLAQTLAKNVVMTENGPTPLQEALSPQQFSALQNVGEDVARSNLANSPIVKPPGSNTFNSNASAGQLADRLGARLGEHIWGVRNLYTGANNKIIQQLADTMLDPRAAAAALLRGEVNPNTTLGQKLLATALAGGTGAGIGFASSQYPQ